ncbi:uncharacterized protein KY384_005016 [Bacidia gigantensis]|uniref:uncharacterized protein n=1 Tax=Bacidia gigantensis TaxID=2732470 RepID=UPI001D04B3BA|nr:uncharacterized protein KY384_005016 [Bacidia gigantensis]KAG8530513.1 hypothetical protein KY384_005016 [Bacidia gigantensis]
MNYKLIQKGWKNFQDGLKNDFKEPNEAVIRSEEQYQQMQDDIDSLEDRAERQIIKISALTSKLHNEQKNSHKLKESNNKVLLAMENKNLFVGRQDSDETVISQFGWLIGQIKTWSVPFAGEERTLPPSGYPPIHAESIRRIAPNVKDIGRFLQSPKCARLFVRGWVSLVMTETLFRTLPIDSKSQIPKEDIWMESSLADAVHTIEMNLLHADRQSVTLRDLHDWRALTTSLVSKQISKNKTSNDVENKVNECLKRIMDVVGPLAPEGKIAQLEHDLHGLLLQAVKLSQTLRCQRASWSVRHVVSLEAASLDGPVVLDDSIMEDVPNDRDHESDISRVPYRIVEVVVTPALFKKGNTDGEQYDVESCVGQAEVRSKAPAVVTNSGDRKRRNHK